jgi:nitrilase
MQPFNASVAQLASVPFDPMASAEKAARHIVRAGRDGSKLLVFPEAYLGCYPKGANFGAVVGARSQEGRVAFQRYFETAIDVPGPETSLIAEAAREAGMFVVMGAIERAGGTLYCTALFFDGARGLIGKHRKLMPTAAERLIWGFGDGSTMRVFDSSIGRVGAVICWENYMPMLRMHMYSQGVTLYCAPTADDRETWLPSMRHIALEGRCFVLTACQHIRRGAYPDDCECSLGNNPETVLMRGGSAIVDPLGHVLAGPDFAGETVLSAEIDPGQIARAKYDFDVVGHYARPDIFNLSVNEAPMPPVKPTS